MKHILYIGNKLSKHGYTLTSIETLGPKLEQLGYKLWYASDKRWKIRRLIDMVTSILKLRQNIDWILIDTYSTQNFLYAWITSQVAKYYHIPYIPILRGGNLPERLIKSPKLSNQIYNDAACIVSVSPFIFNKFKEKGFNTILIPNNIELKKYPFKKRTLVEPNLLWVRSFHKIYNPALAIKLLHSLRKHYPGAKLTMVGPRKDNSFEQCLKLIKDLNLSDKVMLTGKLSKMEWIDLSESHDIFINTTNFDNMPVSVMEAMALGMPVVSTDVGGMPYLIQHGKSGILIPPNNLSEFKRQVIKLLEDPVLCESLSNGARIEAESFDWLILQNKWLDLLGSPSDYNEHKAQIKSCG